MPAPIVTFDFDNTLCMADGLPHPGMLEVVRQYAAAGCECRIVTARNESHEAPEWIAASGGGRTRVVDFVAQHHLPIARIHYTDHAEKGAILEMIGAAIHFDDDLVQLASAALRGVEAHAPPQL